jgi:hypothetical protein
MARKRTRRIQGLLLVTVCAVALIAGLCLVWKDLLPWGKAPAKVPAKERTRVSPVEIQPDLPAAHPIVSNQVSPVQAFPVELVKSNTNAGPNALVLQPVVPEPTPRPVKDALETQIALARRALSPGSIDGRVGSQTRAALRVFQQGENLPVTGTLDLATRHRLTLQEPVFTNYIVTPEDLQRLSVNSDTWLGKSQQARLDFETALELVSEKGWSHPDLIQGLNPAVNWSMVTSGTTVTIPWVSHPPPRAKAAFLRIMLAEKCLRAYDDQTNVLAHFPCSIAKRAEKRPLGLLCIKLAIANPYYVFDPENFPESEEGRQLGRKLMLPSGPNNPVGTVWIGLDRPGYGIHGTPRPEDVGRTESHGCFRLSNWNAEYLMQLVEIGTPVWVMASNASPAVLVKNR